MTKLLRTKTLPVSLSQFFKFYLVCPLYLLALSSSFRLMSLFGTLKSERAAWLRTSCEVLQSGRQERLKALPLCRCQKLYFQKLSSSQRHRNLSHKRLTANGFVPFSSFSSFFIYFLDSRVVEYQALTAKLNSDFTLYLVCPLY